MKINNIIIFLLAVICFSCKQQNSQVSQEESQELIEDLIERIITAENYLAQDLIVNKGDVSNHIRIYQKEDAIDEYITIIPSLGRGVEDYTEKYNSTITKNLVEAGYKVLLIQPRGIGKSTGSLNSDLTLQDMSHDIKSTMDSLGISKLHIVGHAFGNRVARTFATMYTENVDKLMLLACGGNDSLDPEALKCLQGAFNFELPDEERLQMIGCAFFAEGNDPSSWLNGWYPKLAQFEMIAAARDPTFFKAAGGKDFLVVQALEDFVAPPDAAGRALRDAFPDQVTYVELANAGHALTSEKPEEISAIILDYLK